MINKTRFNKALAHNLMIRAKNLARDLKTMAQQDAITLHTAVIGPQTTASKGLAVRVKLSAANLKRLEFGNWEHPQGGIIARWLNKRKQA